MNLLEPRESTQRPAMAKQLILMRHGKSSWKDPTLADVDRPLAKRGRRDAPRAGAALLAAQLECHRVLSSPARRALETARAVMSSWGEDDAAILVEDELYHDGSDGVLAVLARQPEELERIMVIGHNPELEEVLERLTGEWESLPTAAWALVESPAETWTAVAESDSARLTRVWRPREEV